MSDVFESFDFEQFFNVTICNFLSSDGSGDTSVASAAEQPVGRAAKLGTSQRFAKPKTDKEVAAARKAGQPYIVAIDC